MALKKKTFIISNIKVNKEDLRLGTETSQEEGGKLKTLTPNQTTNSRQYYRQYGGVVQKETSWV